MGDDRVEDLEKEVERLRAKVDELYRRESPYRRPYIGYEYVSETRIAGIPLVHIVYGHGGDPDNPKFLAKGIFAIGPMALGVFALGGLAMGVFSFGGLALALLLSLGGVSVGGFAFGGVAIGFVAFGGLAIGHFAAGGNAIGSVIHDARHPNPHFFETLLRYFSG